MNDSIFKTQSIDRSKIHWEDTICDLSPVEKIGGMWFKREDKYAPLGYGGINGSKLRVCIWLIDQALKQGAKGVAHGAVTGSPQHPMVACIAAHYGVPVIDCVGTKKPLDHDTLAAAAWMGAEFRSFNPGYAATLNSKATQLAKDLGYFHLETNITLDDKINSAERIEAFHRVGSEQAKNLPDDIDTLIIPAGSCNSVTGVLYGVARFKPKNLRRIVLMGIGSFGSSDPAYIERRMNLIGGVVDQDMDALFSYPWPGGYKQHYTPYQVVHYNVNDGCGACAKCKDGYCTYNDLMPYQFKDLEFHPRYEGKMMHFMGDHLGEFKQYLNEKSLFWIVGSKPSATAMVPVLKHKFGEFNGEQ